MSWGFPPKAFQIISIYDFSPAQVIIISLDAAKNLQWTVEHASNNYILASIPPSPESFGEQFEVKIENDTAIITSRCVALNQWNDGNKNAYNIEKFISAFWDIVSSKDIKADSNITEIPPDYVITMQFKGIKKQNRKKQIKYYLWAALLVLFYIIVRFILK